MHQKTMKQSNREEFRENIQWKNLNNREVEKTSKIKEKERLLTEAEKQQVLSEYEFIVSS